MSRLIPAEVRWVGPSSVRIMRRTETDRDIVIVANPSNEDSQGTLNTTFGGQVSVWNPETGVVSNVGQCAAGQPVPLHIPADSARFAVWEDI